MRDYLNSLQNTCEPQNDQIPSTDCAMTKKSYETPTWRRITTFLDRSQRLGKWDDVLSDRIFWKLDWSCKTSTTSRNKMELTFKPQLLSTLLDICVWSSLEYGSSDIKSCPSRSVCDPLSSVANPISSRVHFNLCWILSRISPIWSLLVFVCRAGQAMEHYWGWRRVQVFESRVAPHCRGCSAVDWWRSQQGAAAGVFRCLCNAKTELPWFLNRVCVLACLCVCSFERLWVKAYGAKREAT